MNTVIRLGVSILTVVLAVSMPRAAFADCAGGGAALAQMARSAQNGRGDRVLTAQRSTQSDAGSQVDDRASIVGLWQVTFVADDTVIDFGFDAWHADGTETLNDASPIAHNVCLGVWEQTGRRTYRLKHPAFRYDASGNVIGTLILRETNVVDRTGSHFAGDFTIQFYDLAGAVVFEGAGEISGDRVTVD